MKLKITAWLSVLCLTLPLLAYAEEEESEPSEVSRPVELEYLLRQDCGSCHGMTLQGGLGPALLPENMKGKPLEFIAQTILEGRTDTAMPPWRGLLSESDANWLAQRLLDGSDDE